MEQPHRYFCAVNMITRSWGAFVDHDVSRRFRVEWFKNIFNVVFFLFQKYLFASKGFLRFYNFVPHHITEFILLIPWILFFEFDFVFRFFVCCLLLVFLLIFWLWIHFFFNLSLLFSIWLYFVNWDCFMGSQYIWSIFYFEIVWRCWTLFFLFSLT